MQLLRALLILAVAVGLDAHPMGNFSVSHYSRLTFEPDRLAITYVLDLAEIPTFELFTEWGNARPDAANVASQTRELAERWVGNLSIAVNGRSVHPILKSSEAVVSDGAGGMPVLRVSMEAEAPSLPGELSYEDKNYSTRTGWKEIVIRKSPEVRLDSASEGDRDLSHGLTVYPADLALAPPQVLSASARWEIVPGDAARTRASSPAAGACADAAISAACGTQASVAHTASSPRSAPQVVGPVNQSLPTAEGSGASATQPAAPSTGQEDFGSFAQSQPTVPGTIVRGDFLSRMMREKKFGWAAILLGLLAAFGLGCVHALSPGHGKTIVAAYLVGSRGTLRHALFLGFMVTFTHTVSVFLLGLGVLFFQKYVVPDRVIPILGAISGLSIVSVGVWLLYQRSKALLGAAGPVTAGTEVVHHASVAPEQEPELELVGASIRSGSSALASGHHLHGDQPHGHPREHTHTEHQHSHLDAHSVHAHGDGGHGHVHPHHHEHHHDHDQEHHHDHHHDHGSEHHHHPDGVFVHTHTHDGHTHSHAIPAVPARVTLGSLIALGASGGLVPCPSALVLLLSAIALGHTALGLFLLVGFSAGLALVLMAIGALVLYARHLLPKSETAKQHTVFRLLPVFSAVVVIVLGLLMTLTAIGLIQPVRFAGA